jgi:DNA-binding Lrp family transcriptional regulator
MGRNNDKQSDLARALGLPQSALSARMNGHTDFRQREMEIIRNRYGLSAEELQTIFFASQVSD